MKARKLGYCDGCCEHIKVGQEIGRDPNGLWAHVACVRAMKNAILVRHGLTFAGTRAEYRRKQKRRD